VSVSQSVLDKLAEIVTTELRKQVAHPPTRRVVLSVLDIAFNASLRQEEARFVRGTVTYADPRHPDELPFCVRADYPLFTELTNHEPLTLGALVKLARAVDAWTGSIAVFSTKGGLRAWGILDQQVHANQSRVQEAIETFGPPGIFSVRIDGPADLSVFHDTLLLGALRGGKLIRKESSPLESTSLFEWFLANHGEVIDGISRALSVKLEDAATALHQQWARSIYRLCVNVRRAGTGGSFILTPSERGLALHRRFPYGRLEEAVALNALDQRYRFRCEVDVRTSNVETFPASQIADMLDAQTQAEDRENQLTGAIKLVASLATLDGAVVLSPTLGVVGFGAKIEPQDG
jgi:hypothetical protein